MIIIKNVIRYFIQIRHTDDFPSTGTRLVNWSAMAMDALDAAMTSLDIAGPATN